jgi:hypothetical protein
MVLEDLRPSQATQDLLPRVLVWASSSGVRRLVESVDETEE